MSTEDLGKIAYDVDEAVAAPPEEKKVDGLGAISFVGPKNKAKAKQTKNYGHITSAEDYIDALKKIGIEAKPTDWVVYFPESRARLGGGKMKSIDEMLASFKSLARKIPSKLREAEAIGRKDGLIDYLKSVVVIGGEGSIDLNNNKTLVQIAVVHDGSGYTPGAAIAVDQNRYHDLENDLLETCFEILKEEAMKDAAYIKELQKDYGDRWEEVLTETYDGKVWNLSVSDAVEAIKTNKYASKYIEIVEVEPQESKTLKSIDEMLAKLSVEEVDPVFSKVGGIASPSAFDKNISTNEQREIVKMYKRKGFTPVAKVDRNAEHGVGVGLVPGPKSNWPIPIGDGDVVIVYPDGHVIEYYSDGNVNEIPADSIDEMLAKLQKETGDAPEDEDKYDVADLLYDDNSRKIFDDSVDRHNVDDFDYDITSVQGPEKDVGITHSYIEEVAFAEVKFHVDLSDFQERTVRPIEVNDILAILDKWSEEKWPVVFRGRIKAHDNQDDVIADAMVVMELNSKNTTVKKRAAEGAVFDIRVYEKRPEIDQ